MAKVIDYQETKFSVPKGERRPCLCKNKCQDNNANTFMILLEIDSLYFPQHFQQTDTNN